MTDEPNTCALPGCSETIEQPDGGGPPRRYCTPAHRAAARKQRHLAAHNNAEPEVPTVAAPAALTVPVTADATPEAVPPPPRSVSPWSAAASWVITPTPPPPPKPEHPRPENRFAARSAGERKAAASLLRKRAVASVAVASLIAGGGGYLLTSTPVPVTPQAQPPSVPPPTANADQWVAHAEIVLASINKQLDIVALTEASWTRLPEHQRSGQPGALRALQERKALLEQQRVTLQSQIGAFRNLSDVTTDLAAAQGQLDAVERALRTAPEQTSSLDQAEAVRNLAAQRDLHLQQRDYNMQELATLRSGVQEALAAPLPDETDQTTPIVERVLALMDHRPDPRPQAEAREQAPAIAPRRESTREERQTISSTAPPDPSRPAGGLVVAQRVDRGQDGNATESRGRTSGAVTNGAVTNEAVTNGAVTNGAVTNAVRTSGAVIRTAGHVVDTAEKAATNGQSNDDDRSERSEERVRPVSKVVNTVSDLVLGRSDDQRSSSSSNADSSRRSGSVGKSERGGSADPGSQADRRQETQQSAGGDRKVSSTSKPRGKAERAKAAAKAAADRAVAGVLAPAKERGSKAGTTAPGVKSRSGTSTASRNDRGTAAGSTGEGRTSTRATNPGSASHQNTSSKAKDRTSDGSKAGATTPTGSDSGSRPTGKKTRINSSDSGGDTATGKKTTRTNSSDAGSSKGGSSKASGSKGDSSKGDSSKPGSSKSDSSKPSSSSRG
ncbi:MAG TPA: hypothetical protein VFE39_02445 [Pseudonocardia sp.]|nr:hypothetical protein [Pseudonocardia sp.]